jgi:hypothetical protein
MGFQVFSFISATISLECTILLLGAVLFLDYRRAVRRRRLIGHLQNMLQVNRRPELVDIADAA